MAKRAQKIRFVFRRILGSFGLQEDQFGSSNFELTDVKALDESGSSEPFKVASHYAFP